MRLPDGEIDIPIVERNDPQNPTSFDFKLDERYPWCWMEMIASLGEPHMRKVVQKGITRCDVSSSRGSYDFFTHASERAAVKKGREANPQLREQNENFDFVIERIMEWGEETRVRLHPEWSRNTCRMYAEGHTEISAPGELGASEGHYTYWWYKNLDVEANLRFDGSKIGRIPAVAGESRAVSGGRGAGPSNAQPSHTWSAYSLTAAPSGYE